MSHVLVDFSHTTGAVKPMHSVNNGPLVSRGCGNAQIFERIGVPYARNHDASLCAAYGGEHTVDVNLIFTNFDADENDPASYDFVLTDKYVHDTMSVGTKVFYRLGSRIEHAVKKYGTVPPKDFEKYARVCEHIIRHYNEGWADGFTDNIEYWEIWNEPDNHQPGKLGPCWQDTDEAFYPFFTVLAKHLKACFPDLKIGGPALTSGHSLMMEPLLEYCRRENVALDFISYHGYYNDPQEYVRDYAVIREACDRWGYEKAELILNEWNYIDGWVGEDMKASLLTIGDKKGASFDLAVMLAMQETGLDHLMYYDARPCGFNGLFDRRTYDPLPPFAAFCAFGDLYRLKNEAESSSDDTSVYVGAAANAEKQAVALTYFAQEGTEEKAIELDLRSLPAPASVRIFVRSDDPLSPVSREEIVSSKRAILYLTVKKYEQVFIEITPV